MLDEAVRLQIQRQQDDSATFDEHRRRFETWMNNMRYRTDGYHGPHYETARATSQPTSSRQPTARRGHRITRGARRPTAPDRLGSSPEYVAISSSDE